MLTPHHSSFNHSPTFTYKSLRLSLSLSLTRGRRLIYKGVKKWERGRGRKNGERGRGRKKWGEGAGPEKMGREGRSRERKEPRRRPGKLPEQTPGGRRSPLCRPFPPGHFLGATGERKNAPRPSQDKKAEAWPTPGGRGEKPGRRHDPGRRTLETAGICPWMATGAPCADPSPLDASLGAARREKNRSTGL